MGDEGIARLDEQGYARFDALRPDDVEQLLAVHHGLDLPLEMGFFATHAALPPHLRRPVCDAVDRVVTPALLRAVGEVRVFASALLSKGADAPSLPFHQDLTFTDERRHRSYTCWVALVDTDLASGALSVVPGSHRWVDGLRPGGPNETPTARWQIELARLSVDVPLAAGQALVWDAALVHGSHPNRSGAHRPAATVAFAPATAELEYFHRQGDGPVEGFAIDESHFYTDRPFVHRPHGPATVVPWAAPVRDEDFAPHLRGVEQRG